MGMPQTKEDARPSEGPVCERASDRGSNRDHASERDTRLRQRLMTTLESFVRWEKGRRGSRTAEDGERSDLACIARAAFADEPPAPIASQRGAKHGVREEACGRGHARAPFSRVPASGGQEEVRSCQISVVDREPTAGRQKIPVRGRARSTDRQGYKCRHPQRIGTLLHESSGVSVRQMPRGEPGPDLDSPCLACGQEGSEGKGGWAYSAYGFSPVVQRLSDVLCFEVWVEIQYLGSRKTARNHIEHDGNWNPKAANAGGPTQLIRLHGNAIQCHGLSLIHQSLRKRGHCQGNCSKQTHYSKGPGRLKATGNIEHRARNPAANGKPSMRLTRPGRAKSDLPAGPKQVTFHTSG